MRLPLVVLALCLESAGCARTVNRTAERKVRDVLPTYIGPAASWRAHIDSAPMSTVGGRLSRLVIDGEGVHLRQTIVCDRLHIEMRDLVVDTGRQRLRSVGQTTFVVTIG